MRACGESRYTVAREEYVNHVVAVKLRPEVPKDLRCGSFGVRHAGCFELINRESLVVTKSVQLGI